MLAEGILADAAPFLARCDRLPVAAPEHGGLQAQLGQALAELEHYQTVNSHYHVELGAFCWNVQGDVPLPIGRLRQPVSAAAYAAGKRKSHSIIMEKLAQRIDAITSGNTEAQEEFGYEDYLEEASHFNRPQPD